MFKRILCVFCSVVMIFSMISPAVYADDEIMNHEHNWVDVPVSLKGEVFGMEYQVSIKHCTICNLYDHTISLAGYSYEYFAMTAAPGVEGVIQNLAIKLYCSIFGENATATKFTPGGGSTDGSGVGRRPAGYADDNGTPSVGLSGQLQLTLEPLYVRFNSEFSIFSINFVPSVADEPTSAKWSNRISYSGSSAYSTDFSVLYQFNAPAEGLYYIGSDVTEQKYVSTSSFNGKEWRTSYLKFSSTAKYYKSISVKKGSVVSVILGGNCFLVQRPFKYTCYPITICYEPLGDSSVTIVNNITINNNTWNGNIYVDNSTNLTYIYPQYTTVNEKNETVTNISNTPIIYNNETKQYYTYDQTTKNYYYINYGVAPTPTPAPTETPTPSPDPTEEPSPSPTPAPTEKPDGSISTPETGKPGGDTGDTTGILAVLVEIRDSMVQGFLDIKAAFVAGFAELSANFTLAIENLNLNITNIFNKKFPDQSTPETALPSPTPDVSPSPTPSTPETGEPSPGPSPSPTPDPDATPSPTPAPTGKPDSGDKTNNFWTIIFPNGGGTEDGKKGIFWALVSLILALIAFFANLAVGVGYLFPFLPDGVVMTINTCLIVIFLFTIIKFIMRSK